ncbi:MAG: hypothetical protein J6H18_01375 [Lachnospiraceae bacterium]|nr:hypothetical protein [Lachnospiraceae bacterium]
MKRKHKTGFRFLGQVLFLLMLLLLSACAASPGETALPTPDTSAAPVASTERETEKAPETAAPSSESSASPVSAEYPFDYLGVMSEKTRLGPYAPPGEIIDYDGFMSQAAADELKIIYFSVEREGTDYYRFRFDGHEFDNLPCRMSVFLKGSGWLSAPGGLIRDLTQAGYLYHHCLLQKFRPVTEQDLEELNYAPIAWILLERDEGTEVFALSETGYLLHADQPREELPVWEEAAFDMITEEPLPEEVRLHAAALALWYMECENEAYLPVAPTEPNRMPEEYWAVDLSLEGKERTLFGREVLAVKELYNGGILGNGGDWGVWSLGRQEEPEGVIRFAVRNGLKEPEEDKYGLRNELLILPDGSLVLQLNRMGISSFGLEDGFSLWAPIQIRLNRKISTELYQKIKGLIESGAAASDTEKAVPLISAKMTEAEKEARPEWTLPRGGEKGIDYSKDSLWTDFLHDGRGGFFLLDAGEKQLIHLERGVEAAEIQTHSLSFCQGPRLLTMLEDQMFILDTEAVWSGNAFSGPAEDWKRFPLPEGLQGEDVFDMQIELGSEGTELVLMGPEGENYGLLISGKEGDGKFHQTPLGYRLEKTEHHTIIRQGAVRWEAPRYSDELQVIAISSRQLDFCLISPDGTETSVRSYWDLREAPAEAVTGEKSRVVMTDWVMVPGRFIRGEYLIAPRENSLDIYRLRPGMENVIPPAMDPLHEALREAASDAPPVEEAVLQDLKEYFHLRGNMPGQFLYCEFADPREVDWDILLSDGFYTIDGEEDVWGFNIEEEERLAVCEQLEIPLSNAHGLMKIRPADLERLAVYYLGMPLSELDPVLPGSYIEKYDARYFIPTGPRAVHINVLAARALPEGTVLALWEDGYGERAGLVLLRPAEDHWEFISNRIIKR